MLIKQCFGRTRVGESQESQENQKSQECQETSKASLTILYASTVKMTSNGRHPQNIKSGISQQPPRGDRTF